jgi:6-phosphogluconolactonase
MADLPVSTAAARAGLLSCCDTAALFEALAAAVQVALQNTLAAGREASLVVPGGRTPVPFFERLARAPLPWARVRVTLTDERWVPVQDPASNERLVRAHLLQGPAAAARFTGLKNTAVDAASGTAASWAALASLPRPFDVVVLGMGDDGHFASLFPGSPGLAAALDPSEPPGCVAVRAAALPLERLSLNLAALLDARRILLAITGRSKRAVLERASAPGSPLELPIRALLAQRRTPVEVYWAPD